MLSCASLPDQLVAACSNGDIWAAKGLIDVGAVVNDKGSSSYNGLTLPLAAAVFQEHYSCVVLLLSHGADPNGEKVMYYGAWSSTSAIFQLLIDSGGDVNRDSNHLPPLFGAVSCYSHRRGDVLDRMRVLLAEPRLDVAATRRFASKLNPMTASQYAVDNNEPVLAAVIECEVRRFLDTASGLWMNSAGTEHPRPYPTLPLLCVICGADNETTAAGAFTRAHIRESDVHSDSNVQQIEWPLFNVGVCFKLNVRMTCTFEAHAPRCCLRVSLQSAEQLDREAFAADVASVVRLVRSTSAY